MPSIWTYADDSDRGYGLFKRRILEALEQRGWRVDLARASLTERGAKAVLRECCFQNPTDWILLINQSAAQFYDYLEIPSSSRPLPGKKWIWYLDDPRFFVNQPFEKDEYVFCFDETYLEWLNPFTPRDCGFFPLACDMTGPGEYDAAFACDICFVGGVIDQSERANQLDPAMREYVIQLVERKLKRRESTFDELAEAYPLSPEKRIRITPETAHYLYWETNNRYRIRALEALTDFDLRIYGNEDWEKLLADSPLVKHFHGPADPAKDLPKLFASATINLNIHSVQCRGSLNQRDYNAPVAGGFLLSDWVPAAGKFFKPGVEAVYWSDTRDLCAKTAYYLEREEERKKIMENARRRVLQNHTYERRIGEILDWMEDR